TTENEKQIESFVRLHSNPASRSVKFEFAQMSDRTANLTIYDATGRLIKKFDNLNQRLIWDGTDHMNLPVESGVYFYVVQNGNDLKRGKFVFIGK
ncbi:MAG: T9SS type A sorting domain-containing protein, partial [candidate division WOR-3 bacterium]